LISIVALTLEPIKLLEMMEWMEYKNRKTLRELYLDPLMKIGFVARTIQDKPKDPQQQYMLTESGKLFLAGN
jgi:DNA-binding HxlR family transcriptional regulator